MHNVLHTILHAYYTRCKAWFRGENWAQLVLGGENWAQLVQSQ